MSAETKSTPAFSDLHIIMILDESGSMSNIRDTIIKSVNAFISEQQSLVQDGTTFSLIKFNDRPTTVIKKTALRDVTQLTSNTYNPMGGTALYDAIGTTIASYHEDPHVCLVIVTDGEENASVKYNSATIHSMLEGKKTDSWNVLFLSSDLTAVQQATNVGITSTTTDVDRTNSNNIAVTYESLGPSLACACASAVTELRTKGAMRGMGSGTITTKPSTILISGTVPPPPPEVDVDIGSSHWEGVC
jgi:hypothetical protein